MVLTSYPGCWSAEVHSSVSSLLPLHVIEAGEILLLIFVYSEYSTGNRKEVIGQAVPELCFLIVPRQFVKDGKQVSCWRLFWTSCVVKENHLRCKQSFCITFTIVILFDIFINKDDYCKTLYIKVFYFLWTANPYQCTFFE